MRDFSIKPFNPIKIAYIDLSEIMDTKKFTINDLERFSGIKAHTLRAWERRYVLLQPYRTATHIRLYTLAELKKILNIALLKKNGYRISDLSKIKDQDMEDKVKLLADDNDTIRLY